MTGAGGAGSVGFVGTGRSRSCSSGPSAGTPTPSWNPPVRLTDESTGAVLVFAPTETSFGPGPSQASPEPRGLCYRN